MDVKEFEARAEAVRKAKERYKVAVAEREAADLEFDAARRAEHDAYREFTKFVRDSAKFSEEGFVY